ncbi:triphosphoribosyl-dephospho-CoA synthase CitG [Clostridium sp. Cult3]|uniref:triphosphoribosyl-dephospho-CoA synthase CitG n=1 Tax=Clostridium sp. Cult3 TaxID=2079004 RepID=UPI001F0196E4|nr:triphosphoribosyl-dephospho-CoA synthase CitG [Clostridium sp. Cult3]MCF6459941.1 triphosphoribosyl-dephospho-CoA synthase CitG [Clostridium sp. Cult3]
MEQIISKKIAELALKSMLYEVVTAPKPGLVDSYNTGSHKDMDVFTFIDSSISLYPYMYKCSRLGYRYGRNNPDELFKYLRDIGIKAERVMFSATKGVNTQKGLIFILGIICANAARQISSDNKICIGELCRLSSNMVQGIVDRELVYLDKTKKPDKLTAGEIIYLKYGITGIRGEVENGFPTVRKYGLPKLYSSLDRGLSLNNAFVNTLLQIMIYAEDTNVVWRGGMEALELMQNSAKKALNLGGITTTKGKNAIEKMDRLFIEKTISPGGSADLLAATIMFYLLDREFN